MTEKVIIQIETQDNTDAAVKGVLSNFKEAENQIKTTGAASESAAQRSKLSWTEFHSAYQVVLSAVRAGKDIWEGTVGVTVELANQVRQFRDVTGQTAEESSRLVQVLDDYKVSAGDAEKAAKKLASEGYEFNIESLARLSDEYLTLNKGIDRTNFLYDKFGRAGENFAEIMLQGGDAIREANDAISENLILTDKQLQQAREYEKNIDNLNDAWLAYRVTVGNDILPVTSTLIELFSRTNETMAEGEITYRRAALAYSAIALQQENLTAKMQEADAARYTGLASLYDTEKALQDTAIDMEALTESNQDYLSSLADLTKNLDDYKSKENELKDQHAILLEEKRKLIEQGWWAESEAVQDVDKKLKENEDAQAENAKKHEEATKIRLLDMLTEQLAVDGLDARETEFLLKKGLEWGVYSQEAVDAMLAIQDEVAALIESYNSVPTLVQTRIQALYETYGESARIVSGAPGGNRRAGGGSVSGGKMYEVTEMGTPELLNMSGRQYLMMPPEKNGAVIPVGASAGGEGATRGNGVVVNLSYAPMLSLGTDSEIKARLIPIIIQGVQEAKVQGKIQ